MPYIQTLDHQHLFFRDIGRNQHKNQAPIILLHGFGMDSKHWLPFVLPFNRKQRFIIPDLRGFGRSHHINYQHDCIMRNSAEDLNCLVSSLKLDQVKLAGISMGAFVALQYQGIFGDAHVSHYLHIDQSPRCINKNEWRWGLFGQQNQNRLDQARELIDALTPYIFNQAPYQALPRHLKKQLWEQLGYFFADAFSRPTHKHLARLACKSELIAKKIMPIDNWPVYIHCLRAYIEQEYDMTEILKTLQAPLTLLVGLKSDMYPCGGQLRIADHHPNCEVLPFIHSGHTPMVDEPLKFLQTLRSFSCA